MKSVLKGGGEWKVGAGNSMYPAVVGLFRARCGGALGDGRGAAGMETGARARTSWKDFA